MTSGRGSLLERLRAARRLLVWRSIERAGLLAVVGILAVAIVALVVALSAPLYRVRLRHHPPRALRRGRGLLPDGGRAGAGREVLASGGRARGRPARGRSRGRASGSARALECRGSRRRVDLVLAPRRGDRGGREARARGGVGPAQAMEVPRAVARRKRAGVPRPRRGRNRGRQPDAGRDRAHRESQDRSTGSDSNSRRARHARGRGRRVGRAPRVRRGVHAPARAREPRAGGVARPSRLETRTAPRAPARASTRTRWSCAI